MWQLHWIHAIVTSVIAPPTYPPQASTQTHSRTRAPKGSLDLDLLKKTHVERSPADVSGDLLRGYHVDLPM